MAGPGGTRISAAERPRSRQEPPVGEEPDQRPDWVCAAEAVAESHGRAGEQVQRMPERRLLRRRPDQQLPVDQDRMVDAAAVEPLRVRLSRGPQPSSDGRLGTPEAGGDIGPLWVLKA